MLKVIYLFSISNLLALIQQITVTLALVKQIHPILALVTHAGLRIFSAG